jgi:hypothetical protein
MPDTNVPLPSLASFEVPRTLIEPALRALRLSNTALDAMFYDVGVLSAELLLRGEVVTTQASKAGSARIDLGALANPEGCILVVDAGQSPYVTRFDRVDEFLAWANGAGADVQALTVTGVGSSALGSAAFAWNASMALGGRVAAIVPGYGVADALGQALGGWFGFGLREWVGQLAQTVLAHGAPHTARIGHELLASTPENATLDDAAPQFQTGSAASDVLHAVLRHGTNIRVVIGHSKGGLAIGNALLSLDASITGRLSVLTYGCPIAEDVKAKQYVQFLGMFDELGLMNAWGNRPDWWPVTHHSTNTMIPFSMPAAILSYLALR